MQDNELKLIQEFKSGSMNAFEQVVKRFQQYAFSIAFGIIGNAQDAEDVVQEAFMSVYRQISTLRSLDAFPTWLARIVTNLCYRLAQKQNKARAVPLDDLTDVSSENQYASFETKHDVRQALLRLPFEYRAVLVLKEFQGYAYSEIADILEIPIGTVKSRIHQGRTLLADILRVNSSKGGNEDEM